MERSGAAPLGPVIIPPASAASRRAISDSGRMPEKGWNTVGILLRRAGALALGLALALPLSALASDVDVAVVDVTVPTNSVTLAPGASGNITINMSVTGNQQGTATFEVYRNWTLSGGTFTGSNPQEFTVGPRAGGDPATTFSTSGTVSVAAGQPAGAFTLAVSAFDITNTNTTGAKLAAGNPSSYQVTVPAPPSDTTPPVITPTVVGTLGTNDWYTSDVTVSWTVVDNESAISSSSGCSSTSITADTTGTTLTCSATSAGGTASQSVTIKRDATAPTISGSASPAPNGAGWNNTNVTVSFTCGDTLSGVVSCPSSQTLSAEGAGQSATATVFDNAGNSASTTVSGINIDKTAPTINPTVSPNPVLVNGSATASPNASDGLSGVASSSCGTVDTSTVGSHSVTCTATDNAGNTATASVSYNVAYGFTGFFRPVDNDGVLNVVKAGQAIPLKWRLVD
ncbi:MAG TPA: hypothetical protein VLA44_09415, partial [Clostridia bacterium]|nr:hypothetical protein [Clostridia bacterium]